MMSLSASCRSSRDVRPSLSFAASAHICAVVIVVVPLRVGASPLRLQPAGDAAGTAAACQHWCGPDSHGRNGRLEPQRLADYLCSAAASPGGCWLAPIRAKQYFIPRTEASCARGCAKRKNT
jgi:hypothetical protein